MKTTPEAADVSHWTKITLWLGAISLMPTGVVVYIALGHPGGPIKITLTVLAVIAITATLTAFGATGKAIATGTSPDPARKVARARRCARTASFAFMTAALSMVASLPVVMTAQLLQTFR